MAIKKWRNFRLSQVGDDENQRKRIKNLLNNLCEEIHFKAMPEAVSQFIKRNIVGLLLEQIWFIIQEIGGYGIIYTPDNHEVPDKRCKSLLFIDEKVCLVGQKTSIPVFDYLEYYQEHGATEIITEYSGIPVEKQGYVYRIIIEYIRQRLAENQQPSNE